MSNTDTRIAGQYYFRQHLRESRKNWKDSENRSPDDFSGHEGNEAVTEA